MSEHIPDDLLGNACSKQAYGACMPEGMWPALADGLHAVLRPSKSEADRRPGDPVFLRAFVGTAPFAAWDEAPTV